MLKSIMINLIHIIALWLERTERKNRVVNGVTSSTKFILLK